eukprot:CAMPEP_0171602674 /NCGR_PEP_ID=MMETSP0990-20121206/5595_1 /TAXON_ID=483369 /ORGANISM="non described non described, Strain CCMP2098" /LENGTH=715 /DNA_ID=CAMNT_0012164939 /DNA_START=164 /DNA_END=2308 /DNA_ORIENTATION=-
MKRRSRSKISGTSLLKKGKNIERVDGPATTGNPDSVLSPPNQQTTTLIQLKREAGVSVESERICTSETNGYLLTPSPNVSGLRTMDADRRLSLTQAQVSRERDTALKKRRLALWGILSAIYFWICAIAINTQKEIWAVQGHVALSGPESSIGIPALISLSYLGAVFIGTRRMRHRPSSSRWFELMLLFNISVCASHAYVAVGVATEFAALGYSIIGNPAPIVGFAEAIVHRRLGALVVLHYYTSIFELLDTFFLVARKKLEISHSIGLHIAFRLHHVWNWYIAACYACGGDVYFSLCVSATASSLLHLSYTLNLLRFHEVQGLNLFKWVNHLKVFTFYPCLFFGMATFVVGSVPRWICAIQVIEMACGLILFSNFHHIHVSKEEEEEVERDEEGPKLTFSFDSSGWFVSTPPAIIYMSRCLEALIMYIYIPTWCFFYHFGAAMYLQDTFPAEIKSGAIAFSGSSGGAIVATCTALGLKIEDVTRDIMDVPYENCLYSPWNIPKQLPVVLDRHFPQNAHVTASLRGRLRVLMTRLWPHPPFVTGEVATTFPDRAALMDCLQASSQIPVIFGFPYYVPATAGYYLDGLLWMTAFVPWRAAGNCQVCRVSAFNNFGTTVGPKLTALPPLWWIIFPPSRRSLEGMMWSGYCDMAAHFEKKGSTYDLGLSSTVKNKRDFASVLKLVLEYERTCVRTWLAFFLLYTAATIFVLTSLFGFYW